VLDTTTNWLLPLPEVQVKLSPSLAALAWRLDELLGTFGSTHWKDPVPTAAALPAAGNVQGDVRQALDTRVLYTWTGAAWVAITGGATEHLLTRNRRVPGSGTMYLSVGEVNCREAGITAVGAGLLTGVSVRVDAADAARQYDVEVVRNPSGAPALLGALALNNVVSNQRDDLAVPVAAGTELGVRVRKTNAVAGRSSFRRIVVAIRLRN